MINLQLNLKKAIEIKKQNEKKIIIMRLKMTLGFLTLWPKKKDYYHLKL